MDTITEMRHVLETSIDAGLRLFDAECHAYYALLDLARAGVDSGPEWDRAQSAHWRASRAYQRHLLQQDVLGVGLVQAVRNLAPPSDVADGPEIVEDDTYIPEPSIIDQLRAGLAAPKEHHYDNAAD